MELSKELLKTDAFSDILGQDSVKNQLKSALIMHRHVIIVGPPGIGKTTLAKSVSKLLPEIIVNDCGYNCTPDNPVCPSCIAKNKVATKKISGEQRFIRIQGSPDLTSEDLIGDIDPIKAMKFGALSLEAFTPGKIFKANNSILFFDEVNRCSEKLQNSLLQVLEERNVTIGSYNVNLPANFIFIGTMNPTDSSTEKLSDVFLDRFDLIYMHYPEKQEIEEKIVLSKGKKIDIDFPAALFSSCVGFVRRLRQSDKLSRKPSVRATLGLYERAQSNALIVGRKKVTMDDIREAVISVISHRIELKASIKYLQSPKDFVANAFKSYQEDYSQSSEDNGDDP